MKTKFLTLIVCGWLALPVGAAAAGTPAAFPIPVVPAALQVPASAVPLFLAKARGVQIYECRAKRNDPTQFEWVYAAPDADLFDSAGKPLGHHFTGPTWEFNDGSRVVGSVKGRVPSPVGGAVPWLLVAATSHAGSGVASSVTSIQRMETAGGMPPADGCRPENSGQKLRVPYTAIYYFYGTQP